MDFLDYIKDKKNIVIIFGGILLISILITITFLGYRNNNFENYKENSIVAIDNKNTENNMHKNEEFYVEIKGKVKNPGVYKVNNENIVNDLVNLAGGFKKDAYTNNINLSRKLSSESVIYVFSKSEFKNMNKTKVVTEVKTVIVPEKCECSTYDITNCTNNFQSEIIASTNDTVFNSTESNKAEKKININSATKEELLTLSGVGESKADAIIKYRNEVGLFKNIEELLNVSGIGNSIFEKVKNNITI